MTDGAYVLVVYLSTYGAVLGYLAYLVWKYRREA